MKPLNYDNSPCSPTSSNCVIWQGPDLHCIKLCTGDTISDVIANLATELCTVMDQLSITNYDLSCFELVGCKPETYQELLQFLIEQICLAQGLSTTGTSTDGKTNDTLITVAPCFIVNGITVMTLTDYVIAIGLRICSIIDQIAIINNTLNELDIRITNLETAIIPTYTLPSITVDCTLQDYPLVGSGTPALPIDQILSILINNDTYGYCALRTATGLPASLISSILTQCITNSDLQLSTGTAYSTNVNWNSNWNTTNVTVAASLRNIWVVLCDIYSYLEDVITVQDTNTVNLTLSSLNVLSAEVQDTDWHNLEGFDFYTADPRLITKRPMVRRIGNVLHFRGTITIPLESFTSPGTVVEYDYRSGVNTYEGLISITSPAHSNSPFTGAGGVSLLSGGSMQFNNGNSVIPAAVLPISYVIDSIYSLGWRMGWRVMDTGSCSTILTTVANAVISPGGQLTWGVLADLEESFVSGCSPGAWSTSAMNYVISNVTQGNHVTDFKSALNVHDSTLTGNQPTVSFTDPNTVPFTYLNSSGPDFKVVEIYPITINANDPNDLGGFQTILDGLTAFISPCGTLIPTPTPCAIP
jgi:hypothetical protein